MNIVDPLISIITQTLFNHLKPASKPVKQPKQEQTQKISEIAEAYEGVKYFEKQRGKTNQPLAEEGRVLGSFLDFTGLAYYTVLIYPVYNSS